MGEHDGKGLRALLGQTVGGCVVESVLGQGGMGVVFRGRHVQLDRPVAIKFLPPSALKHEHIKRFQREVLVQKSLEHPAVVRVFDADVHEGLPYIVMELVEGGSLRDWLRDAPLPPLPEILGMGIQLFEALAYLHERGVLHRDLKPANVLRSSGDRILVTDFGLARLDHQTLMTTPGVVVGTLTHLAPEAIAGRDATPAVDRYAAGMILYELVTGALPFRFENPSQWIWAVEKKAVAPPKRDGLVVPSSLSKLILGLLGKDPAMRPTNEDALAALRSLLDEKLGRERSLGVRPPSSSREVVKRPRSPVRTAVEVLLTLAVVVTIVTSWRRVMPVERAPVRDVTSLLTSARKLEASKEAGSFEKALSLYHEAARGGSSEAQYHLGYLADVGEGISQDAEEAAGWYRKAMALGHADAEARLAVLCFAGRGVPRDPVAGMEHLQRAADAGSILGASWLGTRLLVGIGVPPDHARARRWLEKGAQAGEPEAQCNMGVLHERGFGVPADPVKAATWYKLSSDQGYAVARFNLGMLKLRGLGVEKSIPEAVVLIRTAAEGGTVEAQDCMGRLYIDGLGVPEDMAAAAMWLARAADAGFIQSMELLGQLHEEGKGVPKDLDKAAFLYKRAQEAGSAFALTRLTNLKLGTGRGFLEPTMLGETAPVTVDSP